MQHPDNENNACLLANIKNGMADMLIAEIVFTDHIDRASNAGFSDKRRKHSSKAVR